MHLEIIMLEKQTKYAKFFPKNKDLHIYSPLRIIISIISVFDLISAPEYQQ